MSYILLRFGPFEADLRTGELRNGDTRIRLAPQAFQLLVLFAERSGDLVTREEIKRALWPNETVVEFDHSINTAVKRIRAALHDSREEPRYLETLPRRGYRFLEKVERLSSSAAVRNAPGLTEAEPAAEAPAVINWSDPIGKSISHYRVIGMLGRGGMGVVYKAEDTRLGRPVALKFLTVEAEFSPVARERFEREARMASLLNHPNICTIYDVELHSSGAFIAMELLEGETLRQRMDRSSNAFSSLQIVELGIQIADALEIAHEHGIIHRDIKPANIFATRRGEMKVLDFGLAKPAPRYRRSTIDDVEHGNPPSDLTDSEVTPGTVAYMSPEQSRGEDLDGRTDLYSLGVLLYEAATGQRPQQPYHLSTLTAKHPAKLGEIIGRLLDSDRDLRYQTARDAASELKRLKRDIASANAVSPSDVPVHAPGYWPTQTLPYGVGSSSDSAGGTGSKRRPVVIAMGTAIILLAATLAWKLVTPPPATEAPLVAERLTTEGGLHLSPDFSPDGKQVVYSWNGYQEDNYDIYVLTIGSGPARRLTTDPAVDYSPAWSPDGHSIAFLKGPLNGVAALMLMPADGGPARKICDAAIRVSPMYRCIEWSRDGRWIVIEDGSSTEEGDGLIVVSVPTGERRKLTHPHFHQVDMQPAISPDGRQLAFIRDVGVGVSWPFVLSLTPEVTPAGEPRHLIFPSFSNVLITSPRWLNGGRELIFKSNRGAHHLWRAPVDGHSAPVLMASLGEDALFPAVSRDGKRLVFSRAFQDATVWSVDTRTSAPPTKVSFFLRYDRVPQFSPDGSRMAFESERSGNQEIWVSDRSEGTARQLTNYTGPITGSPRWSPDGKWIAYDSRVEGQPDIYVISSGGGTPRRLTRDPAAALMPTWSPDGRWIYFCSSRSGSRQVWRVPSTGGNAEQITRQGGCAADLSRDGRTLFYIKQSVPVTSIWKVPADGGEEALVATNIPDRCFAVNGERLYYAVRLADENRTSLRYLDLKSNKVEVIQTVSGTLTPGISVSPDGATLLYRQAERRSSNLMLVNHLH